MYFNKIKEREVDLNVNIGIRGEFRAVLYNRDGTVAYDSGWNSNTIVDNGLWLFGGWSNLQGSTENWYSYCHIGSNGSATVLSQTGINSWLASESSGTNPMPYPDAPRPPVAPDWERYSYRKWRFAAGNGTGTVREFAVGPHSGVLGNGQDIFARHVLPAPIVKAADQALDIFYRIFMYPDQTEHPLQVVLNGVTYDTLTYHVNKEIYNYNLFGSCGLISTFPDAVAAFTTEPGATGARTLGGNPNDAAGSWYGGGNYQGYEERYANVGLDDFILGAPIKSVRTRVAPGYWNFATVFSAVDGPDIGGGFPKTNEEVMTFKYRVSWGRYTP